MRAVPWRLAVGLCVLVSGLALAGDPPSPSPKDNQPASAQTILIYEIDKSQDNGIEPPDSKRLIRALRRRIDPADLFNITIRSAGKERIEIILPTGGAKRLTADDVQRVKDLIARTGTLEFRIVANGADDQEALDQARRCLEDRKHRWELDRAREEGTPPPAPTDDNGSIKAFTISPNKATCTVTYSWVELGPQARHDLDLDKPASEDETRGELWRQAAEAGKDGKPVGVPRLGDALLYSRECRDRHLTKAQREDKQFEYFLLTRDPEKDAKGQAQAISGASLKEVRPEEDRSGRPVVSFEFNAEGARRLRELTRKNSPTGEAGFPRHLAIVLDGRIISAPAIQSEIGARGQISGRFTRRQVEDLVNVLRAGALPAALKPVPVSEETTTPDGRKQK